MSLPNTYKQLEYIQSSGSQRININDFPTERDFTIRVNASYSGSSYPRILKFGRYNIEVKSDTSLWLDSQWNVGFTITGKIIEITKTNSTILLTDGTNSNSTGYGGIANGSLWLFGETQSGNGCAMKFYEMNIYNVGTTTLTHHLIPAKRISDSVLGLYDLVNNIFYTNAGSGTFVAGPEYREITASVNPADSGTITGAGSFPIGTSVSLTAIANNGYRFTNWLLKGYTQLEYIEGTGTQYIDIGYNLDAGYRFKFGFKRYDGSYFFGANSSSNEVVFGYHSGSTNISYLGGQFNYFWDTDTYYDIDIDLKNTSSNLKLVVNDEVIRNVSGSTNGKKAYICGSIGGASPTTITTYVSMKVYYFQVYNGNVLERNFIPVIRHSDAQIGLLDLVNLKFYGNNGTGVFVAGNQLEV